LPPGATRDGKLNLEFMREPAPAASDSPIERVIAEHFVCRRCKFTEADIERVAMRGPGGLASLSRQDFVAISCHHCGLTEFYSLSVLEGRTDLQNLLRGIFGS
jgi:predicted nucleic-acid-binding Zn-ribbon protein